MTQTISVNAIARESLIPREDCEWVEHAYLGEVGTGKILIHDAAGTVVTTGHKTVIALQDAAGTAVTSRLYTGYVGEKTIRRGEYTVGASRWIEVQLNDLNTLLSRKIITGTDGKRPAETVGARLTWLLASDYLTGLVNNYGAVTSVTTLGMDKNDYRGQKPGDVLAACAKKAQFNYYVRWHAGSAAPELVFRDDNAGTADASTLRISNVAADVDSTVTFAPIDATLNENPDDVYSGAYATYAKGAVYETRAATATAFVARDGVTDDSGIKTAASATDEAEDFLWQSHLEEHTLSLTIRVKAAQVNLVRAGDRIQVKLSHLATEGYGSFTWFRVLRRRVTQPLNTDNDYDVALDLSPQEDAPPAAAIVQRAFANGSSAGVDVTLPNPVTIGNLLVVWVADRAVQLPIAPNTDPAKARWGAGAWTRLNGSAATATLSDSRYDGCAMYYKVADATDQTCWYAGSEVNIGVWEIAGGNIAAATLVTKNEQTGAAGTYPIGSLGTAATGSVGLMGIIATGLAGYQHEYTPLVSVDSGVWTQRWYKGALGWSFFDGPAQGSPISWIGDTEGAGAALTAEIDRNPTHWTSPYFAGLALLIPPL